MNRLWICLFAFSICLSSNCQYKADSLMSIWDNESLHDTVRMQAAYLLVEKVYLHSNIDTALQFAQVAKTEADKAGQEKYALKFLMSIAYVYSEKGDYNASLENYQNCLNYLRDNGFERDEGILYINLGDVLNQMGRSDEALAYYMKAVEILSRAEDEAGLATAYEYLGILHSEHGNNKEAFKYFNDCASIREKLGDKINLINTYNSVGIHFYKLGDLPRAVEYYHKSLGLAEAYGDRRRVAGMYGNMSLIYKAMSDYANAEKFCLMALKIFEEFNFTRGIAGVNGNLGLIYTRQFKFTKALESHRKCLEIFTSMENVQGIADAYQNLGNMYDFLGDSAAIRGEFEIARALDDSALIFYQRALEIYVRTKDMDGIGGCYNNIGVQFRDIGLLDSAVYYGTRGLEISRQTQAVKSIMSSLRGIYQTTLVMQDYGTARIHIESLMDETRKSLRVNFPVLNEKEKEGFFAHIKNDYEDFYDYIRRSNTTDPEVVNKAFEYSLLTKGLLLKSSTAMRQTVMNSGDSVLIRRYNEWIDLRNEIAKWSAKGQNTDSLQEIANGLEHDLALSSQEFSDQSKTLNLSWRDVWLSLKEGESAIEFIHFSDGQQDNIVIDKVKYYAAIILNAGDPVAKMTVLFEESQLEKLLGEFPGTNSSYIEGLYGNSDEMRSKLYDLIWKPIDTLLANNKRVYLAPTGLLHKISFAALSQDKDVYLCDRYDLKNRSSTSKIVLPDHFSLNNESTLTLFGGIDYNSDSTTKVIWNYLDGALKETDRIDKLISRSGKKVSYFHSHAATEGKFKESAGQSDIMHIATHGFFYPDPETTIAAIKDDAELSEALTFRGGTSGFGVQSFVLNKSSLMRSGLVFAGANDVWNRSRSADESSEYSEDGVLTAEEVANIDMRDADLVVLSACETGLGDIKGSEGVYGLQRAFKMAGVNYMIMSLWQVPDKETAEFMIVFYEHLMKSNDVEAAFSQTQLQMRKKYDPYYWAAFVLIQ